RGTATSGGRGRRPARRGQAREGERHPARHLAFASGFGFRPFDAARGGVGFRRFGGRFFAFFRRRHGVLVAFRLRFLVHLFFGRFRRFALRPPFLHLLHRLAVVVQAEVPRTAAEGLHFQPRSLVADRAALLEPEDVAALGQREGLVARFRIVGLGVGFPAR